MSRPAVEQLFITAKLYPVLSRQGLWWTTWKSFSHIFPELLHVFVHKPRSIFTSLKTRLYKFYPDLITKTSYLKTNSSRKGIL